MSDIFGQDIKLDENMQLVIAANGEPVLTDYTETGEQDIRLRLFTRHGGLFYNDEFGSFVHDWIHEENTETARMGLENELEQRLNDDQRVSYGTASAEIRTWDEDGIVCDVAWQFIDEDHVFNLVIEIGEDAEMVIRAVS